VPGLRREELATLAHVSIDYIVPEVAPELRQLLDTMHDVPALVLHRGMDLLAWNRGAAALLTDFGARPARERNLIRLTFLDPDFRALYADWPRIARECVAVLRMEAGRHPDDPALAALAALVGELSLRDPDFRTWWASHQVRGPAPVGDLRLRVGRKFRSVSTSHRLVISPGDLR
jgi:hypothetical protein